MFFLCRNTVLWFPNRKTNILEMNLHPQIFQKTGECNKVAFSLISYFSFFMRVSFYEVINKHKCYCQNMSKYVITYQIISFRVYIWNLGGYFTSGLKNLRTLSRWQYYWKNKGENGGKINERNSTEKKRLKMATLGF